MVTLAFKRRQLGGGPKAKWLKGLSSIMLVNREGLMPYLRQKTTFYSSLKARRIKPLWGQRPWHVTHGYDTAPYRSLLIEEYGVQAIISKETKCRCRESDSSVVQMKLGNASGGKAS